MRDVPTHLSKARKALASGQYLLAGGFADEAGRGAYLAAFHAALAFIVSRTGKEPRTHHGTHTEFARLAREEVRMERGFVSFLSQSYEFKNFSDYGEGKPLPHAEAQAALGEAARFVDVVCALVAPPPGKEAS